jgi:Ser/Thr protein kinase RdoA (MazF antagonist)
VNYLASTSGGKKLVVKITGGSDTFNLLQAQVEMIEHLSKRGFKGIPRYIPNNEGEFITSFTAADDSKYYIRILSYLTGIIHQA